MNVDFIFGGIFMSKPIICKKCGTVYTSAQTVCPNCMTRRPRSTEKIIACAAIFFIVIGIVSVLAGTFGDDSESVDSPSAAQSSVPTDGASRITTDEETIRLNIGETLNANGLQITLDEVSDWNSDNMFVSPKDGYKFIRAYFIMKNTNKTDRYLGSFDFTCYADDSKMEKSYYGEDTLNFGNVSSGRNIQGYIYFEVPKNAQKIEIEYETNWWTDKKAYFKIK